MPTARFPTQSHGRTVAERTAEGKALRAKFARDAHGEWGAAERRADPISILIENSKGRLEHLLPLRYGRMLVSPFTFFRGAAAIMAADLATLPTSSIRVQACGDCHLLNFGGFATPERRVIFDINDFDETSVAPWEWDIARLAASFTVAGRSRGFKSGDCDEAAWSVADAYRDHLAEMAEMPILSAWYDTVDLTEGIKNLPDKAMRNFYRSKLEKATERNAHAREFARMAFLEGERPRLKDDPPLLYHPTNDMEQILQKAEKAFRAYLDTLPPNRKVLLDRFKITDAAIKVVGVGSVGTFCGVILLMSGNGDPLFLQFKEARTSVLEPYAGASEYAHRGERVVRGQQIMQGASDMFLGWTSGDKGRHYYIRKLNDAKIKPVIEVMQPDNLVRYARTCGRTLARAHGRSADAVVLSSYLGKNDAFADATVRFARSYADQTERDHAALLAAVRAGRIDAATLS